MDSTFRPRFAAIALAAVFACIVLTSCSSETDAERTATAPTGSADASGSAASESMTPPSSGSPPGSASSSSPPGVDPSDSRSPAAGPVPDRPTDTVKGNRALSGAVELVERCYLLRVADQRWALIGPRAAALLDGAEVQVQGRAVTVPAGSPCARLGLVQALDVTAVYPL